MPTDTQPGSEAWAPDGIAASIGNMGSGPSAAPVGATTVPAPNAKPGPSVKHTAQITALGT